MRIAIIGAGIGGLTAANGLQRAGADVHVWERAAELRVVGSGLSLFGNGMTAFDAVGVGDVVRAVTSAGGGFRGGQRVPDGRWLSVTPAESLDRLRIVHRADLHAALVAGLRPGTLRLGTPATAVSEDGRTVAVADGLETYDVVVAADGIRSAIRASWPGDPGTRYSGYCAWRGVTARPVDLGGEAGETWGTGARFGIAPLRDGRVYWFAVATMPRETRFDDEYAEVRARFAGWHAPIAELIAATDPAEVFRMPIDDLARPLATFRRGRAVLLGDAAHAMTPNLGQGGNQAAEDGATLAALLAPIAGAARPDEVAVEAALTRYDESRRARTQPIAARARAIGALAHCAAPLVPLRNALLRLTPPASLARSLAELQDWQPPAAEVRV